MEDRETLHKRIKWAIVWLKNNKSILQRDIAKRMKITDVGLSKGLARLKEKNDEDFVMKFHQATDEIFNLDWLLEGKGGKFTENEKSDNPAPSEPFAHIDPSSQTNATISAYIEAIASLKRELRTKDELLAEKDARLAEKDERIAELKAHNIDLRHQLDQYQNADVSRYPFPMGAADGDKRQRKSK